MIYPASVTCAIVPEYKDDFNKEMIGQQHVSMNILNQEDDNL